MARKRKPRKGKSLQTDSANIHLGPDGIVHSTYLPGVIVDRDIARENSDSHWQVADGEMVAALIELDTAKSFRWDAKQFYLEEGSKFCPAIGFLVRSRLTKDIGNVALKWSKPSVPARYFTSKIEAALWLKGSTD